MWRQLLDHEIDVLVCTTIIETGVDVPTANTLIIENADRMGLSQLHQLRGRVGRSSRRAYAYLTYTPNKVLTEIAQKRLSAIREFTEFGSGFKIAMRDLEIRGAGNMLGGEQHGHMEAVGYDMYVKLLNEAVTLMKGEEPVRPVDQECLVDLQVQAHIPESYIGSLSLRLDVYRRIAEVETQEDAMDVTDELIDRFGEPPASVKGLVGRCPAAQHRLSPWHYRGEAAGGFPADLQAEVRRGRGGSPYQGPGGPGAALRREPALYQREDGRPAPHWRLWPRPFAAMQDVSSPCQSVKFTISV